MADSANNADNAKNQSIEPAGASRKAMAATYDDGRNDAGNIENNLNDGDVTAGRDVHLENMN